MAWSSPRTWKIEEVSVALLNQEIRDNQRYLHGDDGDTTLLDGVRFENDANFGLWKSGGNPLLGMAADDYLVFSIANNYWQYMIGGTVQELITATGPYVPSGKYLTYAGVGGTAWPLVQNLGSVKGVRFGQYVHNHQVGGQPGTQAIPTGLAGTADAFVFSLHASGNPADIFSDVKITASTSGTVTISVNSTGANPWTAHWAAYGAL